MDYFYRFLDECYEDNELVKDVKQCTLRAATSIMIKDKPEYKNYDKCMSSYDKEKNSIPMDSDLGQALLIDI